MLLNIIVGLFVVGITVVIQGYGTMFWIFQYDKRKPRINHKTFIKKGTRLLISTSVFLIFIHLVQAALWAILYLVLPDITEFQSFEKSLYFSLVTFTTLGYGEITIGSANRILAGLEAINGITLIGWSTAFMFAIFQDLIKDGIKKRGH